MARTDGDINIKTKIDTSGVEKDLKSLGSQLKSVSAGLSKSSGIGAGFAAAAVTAKQAAKAIRETTDALNVQIKAEKQLETAAKNNPYLNSQNVSDLKNYASYLQSISTTGDEVLLPFMAQLASSGRTQAEIMQIMSAALDVSASGMMSLDSAVQQLNATYSGNIGQMGRQISELKTLTSEELASGKAVEVVASKFKGMAEETAKATGSFEQMKNAQGDFNEAVGKLTKPTSDLWNKFWKGWYERGQAAIEKLNNWIDSQTIGKRLGTSLVSGVKDIMTNGGDYFAYMRDSMKLLTAEEIVMTDNYLKGIKKRNTAEEEVYQRLQREKERREDVARIESELAVKAEERRKAEEEVNKTTKTRQDFINDYNSKLQESLDKLELEAELKKEDVSEQDKLNVMLQAYYELVKNIGENDNFSKEKLQELKDYASGIKEVNTNYEDLLDTIKDFLGDEDGSKLSDSIQATIDAMTEENKALEKNSDAWKINVDKIKKLEELKTKVVDKESKLQKTKTLEQAKKIVSTINDYFSEFSQIVNSITELASRSSQEQTTQAMSDLSEQYNNGLIDYEEYNKKKKEITKQAAQEEYKQQLWQYSANILTATANAALAVLRAYAESGVIGAAIAGTVGALQVSTVIANKPKMPAFATGGIVGGNDYNDGIIARLSSREMVLTQAQQAQLFKMANGSGGGGINLKVINNRANDTQVGAIMTSNGLQLKIDAMVNNSMVRGNFNKTMNYANNNANGMRIL